MIRRRVFDVLERPPRDLLAATVQHAILILILISVAALIVETVEPLGTNYRWLFVSIEYVTVLLFTLEIGLRVWVAPENPRFRGLGGRIRYMFQPLSVFDILAVLPFYLTLATVDMRFLRVFRLLRIFRLAKLIRYSAALRALGRVFLMKRFELGVTLLLGALLLLMASSLMYYVEHDAQPELYASIPATMWWAIATLTTVGYGDLAPVTALGRFLGGIIAVLGIAMFALPTGILGAAFVDELKRVNARKLDATGRCPTCDRNHEAE